MKDTVEPDQNLSLFSLLLVMRHLECLVNLFNVLHGLLCHSERANVVVLGKVNDYFVTGDVDSHVATNGVLHNNGDERAKHQVQVKGGQVRCQRANDKLKQVERFQVDIRVIVLQKLPHQQGQWLKQLLSILVVSLGDLLLQHFLDLNNGLQTLLGIGQLQLLQVLLITLE